MDKKGQGPRGVSKKKVRWSLLTPLFPRTNPTGPWAVPTPMVLIVPRSYWVLLDVPGTANTTLIREGSQTVRHVPANLGLGTYLI